MMKLIVDGKEVEVPPEYTLLQACEQAGAEIPRFCYHERLSIAGNCRMCLVELKGTPKPVASCAWGVRDCRPGPNGEPPEINTKTPMVKKAREGVMEFLLINHPLDCPICDQGGECDLQDQAMGYGVDTSRFAENKRAVEDKYLGVLVKTSMNRCIQCTRCVRFAAEVCGVPEMGATGRGEDMEITSYLESALTSELQGNLVDICPVGALTSKPYAFAARPWELGKTQSVDVMDGVGSAIRVDTRGREVMRILPRVNEAINEEWISDKTRHIVDGLRTQRLDQPYVRGGGKLRPASWPEAFGLIKARIANADAKKIGAIAGDLAAVEEMFALKQLLAQLGSSNLAAESVAAFNPKAGRASYIFNPTIAGIEQADALLIIGSNPRKEASILNARIRKRWRTGQLAIGVIGEQSELTYSYDYLGAGADTLADLAAGKHSFAETLKNAKNPIVLIGAAATSRRDGAALLAAAAKLAADIGALKDGWNGFAVLHPAASSVGALDIGFVPSEGGKDLAQMTTQDAMDVVFSLGADEVKLPDGAFVVYIGTHGDRGAHRADVILPGAAYTEKSGTYVNTEGRVQIANRASFPPGDAREDWAIIRALSEALGAKLPFDSLAALRKAIFAAAPHLMRVDQIEAGDAGAVRTLAAAGGSIDKAPLKPAIADYYMTNPIARASAVMAECSRLASGQMLTAAE
ncbi:NADH-quinone oxidoreductase subunit NuoG [Rhodopseudomonas sp. HC1]|uniref:NADH-quinone oxidoreductase subunit NuoG n=1 Tax=Rhodopseudomonas infernalis TaxID=2897386 RepID=UPI001EE7FFA5|nr:NADH-quinone oxidoreductase subunit NuoG [Rhodopseudomonas infernalis]MCG6206927.1 NADH-quinone oxidoreductase subunit NuoG [Rhodopseudomonas infernalis]